MYIYVNLCFRTGNINKLKGFEGKYKICRWKTSETFYKKYLIAAVEKKKEELFHQGCLLAQEKKFVIDLLRKEARTCIMV